MKKILFQLNLVLQSFQFLVQSNRPIYHHQIKLPYHISTLFKNLTLPHSY